MSEFKTIREKALDKWLTLTKRVRNINDDFSDSIECSWQNDLVPENMHSSLFCSIGEWNSNITDMLSETGVDHLDFDNEDHRQSLFRYYTRLMLVVSEILTDFKDLLVYLNDYKGDRRTKDKKATRALKNDGLEFNCKQLFFFINNVCKHKIGNTTPRALKYHKCNHHIDYTFKDDPSFTSIQNSLKVKNIETKKLKKNMTIEVPSLLEIIDQIEYGYTEIDETLRSKKKKKSKRAKLSVYEQAD
jgi:hypothetical protein